MKLSRRYQTKALLRVVRGTARALAGKISSNTTLRLKGSLERATGKIQWKLGKLQGACGF